MRFNISFYILFNNSTKNCDNFKGIKINSNKIMRSTSFEFNSNKSNLNFNPVFQLSETICFLYNIREIYFGYKKCYIFKSGIFSIFKSMYESNELKSNDFQFSTKSRYYFIDINDNIEAKVRQTLLYVVLRL